MHRMKDAPGPARWIIIFQWVPGISDTVLPTTIVLCNGVIRWRGYHDDLDWEASLASLLAGNGVVVCSVRIAG
jgi:hypothetical protein